MKKTAILVAFCLASMAWAWAAPAESPTFLPKEFAGWLLSGTPTFSRDAALADPAFSPLLKEYGFREMEQATYTRPDSRVLKLKAARFADASGAFGAFSFYRQPEMPKEDIGDQAASDNNRVLFRRGNIVVDAVFDRVTAMSAAELRDLAASLPLPAGSAGDLPPVLAYLPKQARRADSIRYFMGAVGLSDVSSPIAPQVVDFAKGAEVAMAQYSTSAGSQADATLMVISYPTPQIAAERAQAIDAALHTTSRAEDPASRVKRSGPLVVLVSGQISNSDAKSLLDQVNYDADITWNQNTFFSKRDNIGNLLVGVILLVALLIGFSLVAGLLFGGFRLLMKRLFPDRIFDRSKDVEIISLKLRDWR
jgi:uncharacterized protein DUF6599